MQAQRKSKLAAILAGAAKRAHVSWTKDSDDDSDAAVLETYIAPDKLDAHMHAGIEQNMDRLGAENALDTQRAYYADELKYFVNCVSKQVVERHLVDTLCWSVLSPRVIAGLSDTQVALLTAEAPEGARGRERWAGRRLVLEKGLAVFKEAMGGFA
jgi:hypothetical protein